MLLDHSAEEKIIQWTGLSRIEIDNLKKGLFATKN